jgi:CRISPR-associated protein Cmr4
MNGRYFAMALDPVHVGTGGYRLGRVDNTIVREPGTNLPKIPGTTIEGNARSYAYYAELGDKNSKVKKPEQACALGKKLDTKLPCGECRICITFGFTRDDKSLHGMAQFSDARILFFPVHSMIGPVWVTTPSVLKDVGLDNFLVQDENMIRTKLIKKGEKLNLGWLYLENEDMFSIPDGKLTNVPVEIKNRAVLVSEKLFSQVVNSNLEVRTSVAIDPKTGAAEEGALFTYEAIPRATVLWFDVTYQDPKWFNCGIEKNNKLEKPDLVNDIKSVVKQGLALFDILGIGGMQTRGFGRIKILNSDGGTAK